VSDGWKETTGVHTRCKSCHALEERLFENLGIAWARGSSVAPGRRHKIFSSEGLEKYYDDVHASSHYEAYIVGGVFGHVIGAAGAIPHWLRSSEDTESKSRLVKNQNGWASACDQLGVKFETESERTLLSSGVATGAQPSPHARRPSKSMSCQRVLSSSPTQNVSATLSSSDPAIWQGDPLQTVNMSGDEARGHPEPIRMILMPSWWHGLCCVEFSALC